MALIVGCFGASAFAQHDLKESNVWAFDRKLGLDFNSGFPVLITTAMHSAANSAFSAPAFVEGCASVSDENGQLLFYNSGDTIWNRNHQVMTNGFGINPTVASSTYQGALIAPVISDPNKYYVFSLESSEVLNTNPVGPGRLYYSVVDMTLDNGLGGVMSGQKAILLDSSLSEMMTIVAGDNCDLWLLVHNIVGYDFKAFHITAAGIDPIPQVSTVGHIQSPVPTVGPYFVGSISVSPDRRRIVHANPVFRGIEVFDFDPAFGIVSNAILLDTTAIADAPCFSPNSSMIYVKMKKVPGTSTMVRQYNVSLLTPGAIINSKYDFAQIRLAQTGGMKLAPDGKIYGFFQRAVNQGATNLPDSLGVINFPDMAGAAAGYNPVIVPLGNRLGVGFDLPNSYWKPLQDTLTSKIDTVFGVNNSLSLAIHGNYFTYQWNDNSTDSFKNVTAPGVYWVTYSNYCTYRTDTFNVLGWPAGVGETNASEIGLVTYPNPAASTVTVKLSGLSNRYGDIVLIDAVGRIVLQHRFEGNQTTIPVETVSAGIYTVEYRDDSEPTLKIRTKLLINR